MFSIYDAETGGSELWAETQNVGVENGVFNVLLGSVNPIPTNLFTDTGSRYLNLTVNSEELSPRMQFTSVPYSLRTETADELIGGSVKSINSLQNDIIITAGDNISISTQNNTLTISATGLEGGTGITQNRSGSSVSGFTNTEMQDLVTTSITIPGPGYIYLFGRAPVRFNATDNTDPQGFILQIDEDAGGSLASGLYSETFLSEFPAVSIYIYDQTVTRTYFKDAPGEYIFRLEGMLDRSNRTVTCFWPVITALYIPVSYGIVGTFATESSGFVSANSELSETPVDGSIQQLYKIDLRELELRAARERLEAEIAEKELLEAQLNNRR